MAKVLSLSHWLRLLLGLVLIFSLLHWLAAALGSDRGQAGLLLASLVVGATLAFERVFFKQGVVDAARMLGLGRPRVNGLVVAGGTCVVLVLVGYAIARWTGASLALAPGWPMMLPGLFAQAGIAEEILFRGYLFGHLRHGRSFWRAAGVSMLPFVGVHLLLLLTLPWPIAVAAVLLSMVLSFPFAHAYELAGGTIWAPALLHFIIQGTPKIVVLEGQLLPVAWMVASAVVVGLILLIPRPQDGGRHLADRI
jgi:membrane protease YdiL (CAAX protease family)